MKLIFWFLSLCLLRNAIAAQAPWSRPDIPVSNRDRVYTADQTSNTVSVIDPAENKLLGAIRLGDPVPGSLSPSIKDSFWSTASVIRRIPRRWRWCRLDRIP